MKKLLVTLMVLGSFSSFASTCYLTSKGGFLGMKTQHSVDDRTVENIKLEECIAHGVDLKNNPIMDSKKIIIQFWADGTSPSEDPALHTITIK